MKEKLPFAGYFPFLLPALFILAGCAKQGAESMDSLREGFLTPPVEARPRALWDWVDGNVEPEQITYEMEEAARMGMGGFDIWDVTSVVDEDSVVPAGPAFMSDSSVSAICHAINEAERLGLDLGLIIASGWNAGGPWTLPEHQTMGLFRSVKEVTGPGTEKISLEFPVLPDEEMTKGERSKLFIPRNPDGSPKFSKEVCVLAYQLDENQRSPVCGRVLDLSTRMDEDGSLLWEVPEGKWSVIRYVCANTGQPMYSSSPNSAGPMIDHFNAEASERHINYFIRKIESALGKSIGGSGLSYFYTDSYEVKGQLWTPSMPEEFEKRAGYSMIPYLPALDGLIVEDRETTLRFLFDYRKVLSDLIIDNHYRRIREICEAHGVGFVAEAAGPGPPIHNCPFESLKSSGALTIPRGEFWHLPDNSSFWRKMSTKRKQHYLNELQVVKGVASASHIYDLKLVEAEAFTGTHLWNEGPGDLKPTADRAFCEGLNRINFHTWPHTPVEAGSPGWVYAFGTLINEHRIWWPMARPWIDYLARCSYMLQQGNFAADLLIYYGDSVPNFVPARHPVEGAGFGYDYDVINSDVLLNRLEVKDGRLVLPHGPSYEVLVLPDATWMQPRVVKKLEELVKAGAVVSGPKPVRSHGLLNREQRDREVRMVAESVWGECDGKGVTSVTNGKGRVYWCVNLREILEAKGVGPDVKFDGIEGTFDFIHRKSGDIHIYFIRNTQDRPVSGTVSLRQPGSNAEIWDPASGRTTSALVNGRNGDYLEIPLSLEAHESLFVVIPDKQVDIQRNNSDKPGAVCTFQKSVDRTVVEIPGPWNVEFKGPVTGIFKAVFDTLQYWNERPEDAIRFFSGIASYTAAFEWDEAMADPEESVYLDLDQVSEVARITVNGQELEILWKEPFRADLSGVLREGTNEIMIEVANTWANGLAGDHRLPPDRRVTRSNVTRLPNAWAYPMESIPNDEYQLIPAGLAGPVKIVTMVPLPAGNERN